MQIPPTDIDYFQDHMPGNICFGCGRDNHDGLKISSFWQGEEAHCIWTSQAKYQGWKGVLNGGILATIIDCHTMCTAMAYAYKSENRVLDSKPIYRYATGTLTVKYLKPTLNDQPITLKAKVVETKGRKTVLTCDVISNGELTAQAEAIAIRVFDSSKDNVGAFAKE
jgi:acyl-coenzyme A thioesterase PaaI-like protein